MSSFLKYFVVFLFVAGIVPAAHADIIWPALFLVAGFSNYIVIILDFLIETAFLQSFMEISWKQAFKISTIMNLASLAVGVVLIFFSMKFMPDGFLVFTAIIGAFIFPPLINTLVEGYVVCKMLKRKFKEVFWWLLVAHIISIVVAFIGGTFHRF